MWRFLVLLSLSHKMFWVRCDTNCIDSWHLRSSSLFILTRVPTRKKYRLLCYPLRSNSGWLPIRCAYFILQVRRIFAILQYNIFKSFIFSFKSVVCCELIQFHWINWENILWRPTKHVLLFSLDKLNFLIEDGGHFIIVLKPRSNNSLWTAIYIVRP